MSSLNSALPCLGEQGLEVGRLSVPSSFAGLGRRCRRSPHCDNGVRVVRGQSLMTKLEFLYMALLSGFSREVVRDNHCPDKIRA